MAVVYVKIMGHLETSSVDKDGTRTCQVPYLVKFDAPASAVEAETADDGTNLIPPIGDGHPADSSRKVVNVSAKAEGDVRTLWRVDVQYEFTENQVVRAGDPLDDPWVYEWEFGLEQQDWFKDCTTGTPQYAVNTAGEPFDGIPARDVGTPRVTLTRNIAAADWNASRAQQVIAYTSDPATAINTGSVSIEGIGFSARQLRFSGYKISPPAERNSIAYRTETITLTIAKDWRLTLDSRGQNEKSTGGKLKEIVKGTPPTKVDRPWPLDSAGAAKANATDAPATVVLKPYPELDFSVWSFA